MKIACLTPTKLRHLQIEYAIVCMNNQTLQPDLWVIVDDGDSPIPQKTLDKIKCRHLYVHKEPAQENSTVENLEIALKNADADVYVVIEDDDYYPPCYLEEVSSMAAVIKDNSLLGDNRWIDYSLKHKCWMLRRRYKFAQTHSQVYKGEKIKQTIVDALSKKHGDRAVDCVVLDSVNGQFDEYFVDYKNATPISLKAWPDGTPGTVNLHYAPFGTYDDDDFGKFKSLLGDDWKRYYSLLFV